MTRHDIQLFIDSIWHWQVDGIDKFEEGLSVFSRMTWSDGSELKLTGEYCPLCHHYYNGTCRQCPLYLGTNKCFKPYRDFIDNPTIETCQSVIDDLHLACSSYYRWRSESRDESNSTCR